MAVLTGRNGQVAWNPPGTAGSPTSADPILSLNAWVGNFTTDYENVESFGDSNKVYLPGLKDAQGTLGGFWNSSETTIFVAASQSTPGWLMLSPNTLDGGGTPADAPYWAGLAYMDGSINCSLSAPKVTGNWKGAGPFALFPTGF